MKLYTKNSSVVYFGQIDNPFDIFLSKEAVYSFLKGKKGRIIDLGCGAGRNLVAMAKMNFEVVGVDNNKVPIKIAKEYIRNNNVEKNTKLIKKDIKDIKPNEFGKFDFCILQEVVEHIENYQEIVDVAYSLLKTGGILILTTQYNPKLWNALDVSAGHVKRFTK